MSTNNNGRSNRPLSFHGRIRQLTEHVVKLEKVVKHQGETIVRIMENHDKVINTVNAMALHLRELPNNPAFLAAMIARMDEMLHSGVERAKTGRVPAKLTSVSVEDLDGLDQTHQIIRITRISDDPESKVRRMELAYRQPNNDGTKFAFIEMNDEDVYALNLNLDRLLQELEEMQEGEMRFFEVTKEAAPAGGLIEIPAETVEASIHTYPLIVKATLGENSQLKVQKLVPVPMEGMPTEIELHDIDPSTDPRLANIEKLSQVLIIGGPITELYFGWVSADAVAAAPSEGTAEVNLEELVAGITNENQHPQQFVEETAETTGQTEAQLTVSAAPFEGSLSNDAVNVVYDIANGFITVTPQNDPHTAIQLNQSAAAMYRDLAESEAAKLTEPATQLSFYVHIGDRPAEAAE